MTVLIGEPINFEEQLATARNLGLSGKEIRKSLTDVIQNELDKLKIETLKLHRKR